MTGVQAAPANARVVIVGAGHAGGSVATLLRQAGHVGSIVVFGDQPYPPYQRPPLSKAYLKGAADLESLKLKDDGFYAQNQIDLRLNASVATIERDSKVVRLADGITEPYDYLVLATGSKARDLPLKGADAPNVHMLASVADAEAVKAALSPGKRLAVIGGGYVGLEVAASARLLGADAVIVERESRVLARVACAPLSTFFNDYHVGRGVEIVSGATIESLDRDMDGLVRGIVLASGDRVACDSVLVGIGAVPNEGLAAAAGLLCDNGVVVDSCARTSDPAIFAIGDVSRRPMPLYGDRLVRLESVPNALEQGKQAATAILGKTPPTAEVPWFWSDQYDLKLQIAGMTLDAQDYLIRGDISAAKFAIFHMAGDHVRAVEAVNSAPEFMMGRMLIASGQPVSRARLQDPAVPIKQVVA